MGGGSVSELKLAGGDFGGRTDHGPVGLAQIGRGKDAVAEAGGGAELELDLRGVGEAHAGEKGRAGKFDGAEIHGCAGDAGLAALVGGGGEFAVARVYGGAAGEGQHGGRGAAVIGEGAEQRVGGEDAVAGENAAAVGEGLEEVRFARREDDGAEICSRAGGGGKH